MSQLREINWPDGPQQGDIHTEGGRTWEYVLMPPDSSVEGVWRDVGCKDIVVDGPSWTLDYIKDWLGIEGNDQDDQILSAMKVTMAFVERYCNRLFEYRENHLELKLPKVRKGFQLHLWPVSGKVQANGVYAEYTVDDWAGILWFKERKHDDFTELRYNGGYMPDEWPADLLSVLLNSVKNQWAIYFGPANSTSISRVTIPDVGTISYDTKADSNTNIGLGASFGPVSQSDQMVLDFYRLHEC